MDESNDKVNKSCIILVKVLDSEVGDVRTQFVDMPIINITWKSPKPVCSFEGVIRQMWPGFFSCCDLHVRHNQCYEGGTVWSTKAPQE